jgi:hypothetical protein
VEAAVQRAEGRPKQAVGQGASRVDFGGDLALLDGRRRAHVQVDEPRAGTSGTESARCQPSPDETDGNWVPNITLEWDGAEMQIVTRDANTDYQTKLTPMEDVLAEHLERLIASG